MTDRLERFIRTKLRSAGRNYERARRAYGEGLGESNGEGESDDDGTFGLPTEADGRARIVCRRYVEKRAVHVDDEGRPSCFDPDHPDCRGCAEDVREGIVETW